LGLVSQYLEPHDFIKNKTLYFMYCKTFFNKYIRLLSHNITPSSHDLPDSILYVRIRLNVVIFKHELLNKFFVYKHYRYLYPQDTFRTYKHYKSDYFCFDVYQEYPPLREIYIQRTRCSSTIWDIVHKNLELIYIFQ